MIYWGRTDENSNGQHEVNRRLLQMLRTMRPAARINHVACKGRLTGFVRTLVLSAWENERVIYVSGSSGRGLLLQALQVAVLLLLPDRRIYLHMHSSRHLNGALGIRILAQFDRVVLVFLNAEMQEHYAKKYPAINGSVVIDNTVFFPATATSVTRDSILFLSRAEHKKGIDRFLALADVLACQYPNFSLDVAGSTTDSDILKQITRRAHVNYHGEVKDKEKQALLERSAVFVFPSRYQVEAFSLSVIEAAATGARIVCSNAGFHSSFIEVIEGMEVYDWEDCVAISARLSVMLNQSPATTNSYVTYRKARLAELERWIDELCPPPRCSD